MRFDAEAELSVDQALTSTIGTTATLSTNTIDMGGLTRSPGYPHIDTIAPGGRAAIPRKIGSQGMNFLCQISTLR